MDEARKTVYDMVSRLGVSHFGFCPAAEYEDMEQSSNSAVHRGVTDIDLRVIDGQAIVTSVAHGSPAEVAGVRRCWKAGF
ncbi:MAG: hypothetical protein QF879_14955 [Candidatus Latescibacteria bacterium]|nr:hypothetical protein [Candidatus Latescibacterota bacterium]MDP7235567.1 hypothetical protein [Candidatus Latescibacterota bacterium]